MVSQASYICDNNEYAKIPLQSFEDCRGVAPLNFSQAGVTYMIVPDNELDFEQVSEELNRGEL